MTAEAVGMQRSIVTTDDGYLVDEETGEILAASGAPAAALTREDVENVLERMQRAEARIAAIKAQRQAILDNLERMEKREAQRLTWLNARYLGEMEEWTREQLGDGKRRSIDTPYGRIGVRGTPGSIKIADEASALEWCSDNAPAAIAIKRSVLVSALKDKAEELPDAFAVTPAGEKFYVKTGVKVDGDAA